MNSSPDKQPKSARSSDSAAIQDRAALWKARADAGLTVDQEMELRAWLEADPRHREAAARFETVWDKFDRPFETGKAQEVLGELEKRARHQRTRIRSVTMAAAFAVIVLAGVRSDHARALFAEWGWTRPVMDSAVVLMPERRELPDGSVVELKPGAVLEVQFSPEVRRVVLSRGEAHFKVQPNPAWRFVVAAGDVEARAVGTAFAVQVLPDTVEVLVTHGQVAVEQRTTGPNSTASQRVLEAMPVAILEVGHSVVVNRTPTRLGPPRVEAVQPGDIEERLAWRAPRVEFTRATLADAIAVLNRHSAKVAGTGERSRRFVLAERGLGEERVSGLFRIDRTDAFVNLLKHGFGLEAEHRATNEIVLRRSTAAEAP